MQRIQKKDTRAFEQFVDRYLTPLHHFAYRWLGNHADAQDVIQEAFLRIWNHAQQWKHTGKAQVSTWVYRIVYHLCIDHHRRIHSDLTELSDEFPDTKASPEQVLQQKQISDQVKEILQQLPERQRSAIILCYYQELSNRQAAEILEVNLQALESLLARGRRTLRQKLEHQYPDLI